MTALPQSGAFSTVDPTHVAAVGPAAAILYARILWRSQRSGEWRATRSEMSAETGLSQAMLRTAVDVLREREWVSTRRTSMLDATLVWSPIHAGQAENAESAISTLRITQDPPAESAISSLETERQNTCPSDDEALFEDPIPAPPAKPLRSVPSEAELDAEFTRFWELYPRRTARKAARTAYGRARRTATVEAIATGLRAQLPSMQAAGMRYVPYPATWLNQGRWEDDVRAVPQGEVRPTHDDPFAHVQMPPRPRADLYG